jgi:hypothetical protein
MTTKVAAEAEMTEEEEMAAAEVETEKEEIINSGEGNNNIK